MATENKPHDLDISRSFEKEVLDPVTWEMIEKRVRVLFPQEVDDLLISSLGMKSPYETKSPEIAKVNHGGLTYSMTVRPNSHYPEKVLRHVEVHGHPIAFDEERREEVDGKLHKKREIILFGSAAGYSIRIFASQYTVQEEITSKSIEVAYETWNEQGKMPVEDFPSHLRRDIIDSFRLK